VCIWSAGALAAYLCRVQTPVRVSPSSHSFQCSSFARLILSEKRLRATLCSSCIGSFLLASNRFAFRPSLCTSLRWVSRSLDRHLFAYGEALVLGTRSSTVSAMHRVRLAKAASNCSRLVSSAGCGIESSLLVSVSRNSSQSTSR
jgi:hypothetical protein